MRMVPAFRFPSAATRLHRWSFEASEPVNHGDYNSYPASVTVTSTIIADATAPHGRQSLQVGVDTTGPSPNASDAVVGVYMPTSATVIFYPGYEYRHRFKMKAPAGVVWMPSVANPTAVWTGTRNPASNGQWQAYERRGVRGIDPGGDLLYYGLYEPGGDGDFTFWIDDVELWEIWDPSPLVGIPSAWDVLQLKFPQREFIERPRVVGGFRETASQLVRATRVISRGHLLDVNLRVAESEKAAVRRMVAWMQGNPMTPVDFWPDYTNDARLWEQALLVAPMPGSGELEFAPSDLGGLYDCTLTLIRPDGLPWDFLFYGDI